MSGNDRVNVLDAGRRSRGAECASDLTLDRLALGELTESERSTLETHLAACTNCASASARLIEDRAVFAREAAFANLAADAVIRSEKEEDAKWRGLWRRFFIPMAAIATIVVVTVWTGAREGNRTKGEFALSPYVLHPESTSNGTLHMGEPLHPGDRLQFRYNGARAGHLTIVSVDEAGKVSVYYPPGPMAAQVAAGKEVALSTSVELDATLGREMIIGVRCDEPVAVDGVVSATRRAVEAARARGVAATELGPLGLTCAETRHQIVKERRTGP